MNRTRIPYADVNWPIVTGCSHGCPYCWARGMAHRFGRSFAPSFHAERLSEPIRARKPRRVLVAFTGDLFDPAITNDQIAAVFGVMAACPRHRFFILTKRAERMAEWFAWVQQPGGAGVDAYFLAIEHYGYLGNRYPWPLLNVWIGVSVTSQADAEERIPRLLRCPATKRYVSAEPLLGPVDLIKLCDNGMLFGPDWVVAGAQSGPHAAPCDPAWARRLRDDCKREGVPFAWKNPTGYPPLDGVVHGALPMVSKQ